MSNKCAGCEALKEAATTQLNRPIEPGEIRVGDTIERRFADDGCAITHRMTVARIAGNYAFSPGNYGIYLLDCELILIDRPAPTPAPAVGSRWRTEDGAEWVINDCDVAYCYKSDATPSPGKETLSGDHRQFSKLVNPTPIPDHGDGCSPWLWDKETDTGWVASQAGVTDTHVQVFGERKFCGFLTNMEVDRERARRLRPWSERGQANG